jgi:ubiquinone biosynthesis protein UbiJ
MFSDVFAPLGQAAMERLTLLLNHVLNREPAAMERLRGHVGLTVLLELERWPALLPPPPTLAFRITPAGLLEWVGAQPSPATDLRLLLDASNPAALGLGALSGRPPAVRIEGDSRLAGDVDWLIQNLRWDIADDLQRVMGPMPAQFLSQLGKALAQGMAAASQLASAWGDRRGRGAP